MSATDLLREVLASPTTHEGVRTDEFGVPKRYTAKRLPDDLLVRIREEIDPDR